VHPPGAGASALEHLLDGRPTVAAERGLLLDSTRRMHPEVAGFVSWLSYEDLLHGHDDCARQRVGGGPAVLGPGVGVRWLPMVTEGCGAVNPVEAQVAVQLVTDLLRQGTWTDAAGRSRALVGPDILVLGAYNQQVNRLLRELREAAGAAPELAGLAQVRVGTVDSCQGQEAAVVIYSLASSSAADAPRGVDFLLSPNRLNVAISRARGVAIVIGSPRLLDSPVSSPDRLRAVNGLCALVEYAERREVVDVGGAATEELDAVAGGVAIVTS
jgi:superfamily I DNA and/or RNA helicase